ncbi:MAG: hypothetical protein ABH854_04775 [Candidatus Diapherotrites archaeon]|nr:hypothetical protein [Candidatus Micrarchaeota archaeon]MBU1939381.1 hypothetical protein [Candidatus Micrarchaeota archaeon]
MSPTPDTFYLDSVRYLPEKHQAVVKLRRGDVHRTARFNFSPRAPLGGFEIEPERQFLIGKNWAYFDAFILEGEEPFKKRRSTPALLPSLLEPQVQDALSSLCSEDEKGAEQFARGIALSNILCTPPSQLPQKRQDLAETMLENIFFRNSIPLPEHGTSHYASSANYASSSPSHETEPGLDFSGLWPAMLSHPFMNLGHEAMNCLCCRPDSPSAPNLSPSSLVNVKFTADGIFFESHFTRWALGFHNSRPEKERRSAWRREWALQSIPIGPFFRGQEEKIPLADLPQLSEKQYVSVLPQGHEFIWFCRNSESALSSQIRSLSEEVEFLGSRISTLEKTHIKNHKLFFSHTTVSDPKYIFLSAFRSAAEELLTLLPSQLANPKSRFYSARIADAISCLRKQTIGKFRAFSAKQDFRVQNTPLLLARQFSSRFSMPAPAVVI